MIVRNSIFIWIRACFLIALFSPRGFSQDEAVGGAVESSPIEDSTLDNSNTEAVDAANAVTNDQKPAGIDEAGDRAAEEATAEPEATAEIQEQSEQQPAPQAPTEVVSKPDETQEVETSAVETPKTGIYGGKMFGKYKVQLAANVPTFNEGQKCYDKLYGKAQAYMTASGDWFPLDWWVNPGVMMKMGIYSVRGKAATGSASTNSGVNCDSLTVDDNSRTSLLFVPVQVGGKLQMSPFRSKWLVLDLYTAVEYGWWQETRDSSTSMVHPVGRLASSGTQSSSKYYTSTGHKNAIATGISAHALLNPLDETTVRSMNTTMGIGYVYLTGFFETVKSTSKEGLTFGRNTMGIGFTFEAIN